MLSALSQMRWNFLCGDRVAAGPESQSKEAILSHAVLVGGRCDSSSVFCVVLLTTQGSTYIATSLSRENQWRPWAWVTKQNIITSFFSVFRSPSQLPYKRSLQSPLSDLYLGVCNLGRAALLPGRSATCTNVPRYQYGLISMSSGEIREPNRRATPLFS